MTDLQGAMTALAAGDRSAFDVVFRALWPRCRGFAHKLLDDDALADDAAQQALLQLFHEAPRFDAKRSALSWALTLTAWQVRTAKRKRERRRETHVDASSARRDERAELFAGSASSPSPEDAAVRARMVAAALDVVAELTPADRDAVMRALDDDTAGNPAQRKRRQRAFERLRAFWSARYG